MKKLGLSLVCFSFLIGSMQGLEAGVYSTVGDSGITAIDLVTGITKTISASAMGLQSGDDIDALSLGDDTKVFGPTRFDFFAVDPNAVGLAGALKARAAHGLAVAQDIYVNSRTKHNKLYYRNLVNNGAIDGFDFGNIADIDNNETLNKWVYFSLTPNSPTLSTLGATAGDILTVIPNLPSTLKVFVTASTIGGPSDIDALSMHITGPIAGYDGANDYIIYAKAGSSTIYHYGYGAPSGNQAHSASEFGLNTNDTIQALEHKEKTCYDRCLHVKNGWQLFGLSGGIANVNEMFKDKGSVVNALWAYDRENQKWKFYSPNPSLMVAAQSLSYEMLNTLDTTEGFWLQGKEDSVICTPTNVQAPDSNQTQTTFPTSVTFSEGPNMQVARMTHWIIPLPDNNIEVIGGHGSDFVSLASAEKWDATTNSFTSKTTTNATHDMSAMAKLSDGTYFISGGAANLGVVPGNNVIEIFNPLNGTFTSAGTMLKDRVNHSAVEIVGGKVLIVGGWYDPDGAKTPEIYDLATHTSSLTGPLNTPRSSPWVLPTNDGKAVVFWGVPTYGGAPVESVELYNPADNNFSILAPNILGEAGWLPEIGHLDRPISSQKMNNGKYLLWGHKDSVTSLITFDPETKSFAKLNTTPALPAYTDEVITDVLVDNKHNVAAILAFKSGAEPEVLTVYLVDLSDDTVTKMNGEYTFPSGFYTSYYGSNIILNDDRIMITGGHSQTGYNTNFSPVAKTIFIEFK